MKLSLGSLAGRAGRTGSGRSRRFCPVCSWTGPRFAPGGVGTKKRFDCRCPGCGSMERHRLAFLVAEQRCDLDFSSVLHVAPERELSRWLRSRSGEYLSVDLYSEAMARMDVTELRLEDGSRTLVWASHVLEHVEDDRKAISEIYRVLRPNGTAFIQVPLWRTTTFEDPSRRAPEERAEAFYQADHVRLYGLDLADRFEEFGFSSTIHRAQDFGPDVLVTNGLSFASTNEVFVFRKIA